MRAAGGQDHHSAEEENCCRQGWEPAVRALRPRYVRMVVGVVALPLHVIIAATPIETRVGSQEFRGPRQKEHHGADAEKSDAKKTTLKWFLRHRLPRVSNGFTISRKRRLHYRVATCRDGNQSFAS